jgi:MFS family permease
VGTALGPSLGGVLVGSFGWPAIFLVNLPLGALAFVLAFRFLPSDPPGGRRPAFDTLGSALLALSLAAYALSMTLDRTSTSLGIGLLCAALCGAGLFVRVEARARSPLVSPALFRNRVVATGFLMSGLVTTVAMTTLLVGPFYLSGALRLGPAAVGLIMTSGPLVAALVGVPAGRAVDRFGAPRMTIAGLLTMLAGCAGLALMPVSSAIVGYVLPLVMTTAGFAIFQAANNTAVVTGSEASQRGVVSGLLTLSRNLGLFTGASAMGAVFVAGTRSVDVSTASVAAIAAGTHAAFTVAAMLVGAALLLASISAKATPSIPPQP